MQAIETKYLCPTKFHGVRVIAKCQAKRIIVPWDHAMNPEDNHRAAALKLARQLGWLRYPESDLISGQLVSGSYAHVLNR